MSHLNQRITAFNNTEPTIMKRSGKGAGGFITIGISIDYIPRFGDNGLAEGSWRDYIDPDTSLVR